MLYDKSRGCFRKPGEKYTHALQTIGIASGGGGSGGSGVVADSWRRIERGWRVGAPGGFGIAFNTHTHERTGKQYLYGR